MMLEGERLTQDECDELMRELQPPPPDEGEEEVDKDGNPIKRGLPWDDFLKIMQVCLRHAFYFEVLTIASLFVATCRPGLKGKVLGRLYLSSQHRAQLRKARTRSFSWIVPF